MGLINFSEIPAGNRGGPKKDQFEQFSRDFLETVVGWTIEVDHASGPDGGIDLKCRDKNGSIWLVSCKHYAESGNNVGPYDEQDIIDRVHGHGCEWFCGLYSTNKTQALQNKLIRLRDNGKIAGFELWDNEKIEAVLLSKPSGMLLAQRYFPKSWINHSSRVICLVEGYELSDLKADEFGFWYVPDARRILPGAFAVSDKQHALHAANELLTSKIHLPSFTRAWLDGVALFPEYFEHKIDVTNLGNESEKVSYKDFPPKWEALDGSSSTIDINGMQLWFVLCMWGLYDQNRVHQIMRRQGWSMNNLSLPSLALTKTSRRDILVRLLAYSPI